MNGMIETEISHKEGNKVAVMTLITPSIDNTRKAEPPAGKEHAKFIICMNCFWCASLLNGGCSMLETCPNCSTGMLEIIPLISKPGID
jgi:hypothetical protein